MYVPRVFRFRGYQTIDIAESFKDGTCKVYLERNPDKPMNCVRCGSFMTRGRGRHHLVIEGHSAMGLRTFIHLWREKGHCPTCKKARAEHIDFVAKETPHLTQDYAWWIGRMCEFSAVSRVAEFLHQGVMTVRRVDRARMLRMLKHYKIPDVTHISVDEVYVRNKPQPGESRDDRFFTIVTDLKSRRVIWVAEGRSKKALDEFFRLIGQKACNRIVVAAMDQYEGYRASVREHCPKAQVVWDKFHLMQNFNEALNEDRKTIHDALKPADPVFRLTLGRYRYIFLKRDSRRSPEEKMHIHQAMAQNEWLMKLELIKERVRTFFDAEDTNTAWDIFDQVGDWIQEVGAPCLKRWWEGLEKEWDTLKNYFDCRVTSAVSEGINNTIKTLKRRAYGYRDMMYFRLKIMQVCGYLNAKFIPNSEALSPTRPAESGGT
jgi:transposase